MIPFVTDGEPFGFEPASFRPSRRTRTRWRRRPIRCPAITLLCNSISASKSKCGFNEFEGHVSSPPKKYLTKTTVTTSTCSATFSGGHHESESTDKTVVDTYDPVTCATSSTCTGTSSADNGYPDGTRTTDPCTEDAACNIPESADHTVCQICYGGGIPNYVTCTSPSPTITATTYYAPFSCTAVLYTLASSGSTTITLSDEFTTDALKDAAVAALPAYADCFDCNENPDDGCSDLIAGQGCTCSAYAHLSTDETSYTIRRFQYKFVFPDPADTTGYLKILWNITFKPTLAAGVDYCGTHYSAGAEDPDPRHWTITPESYVASGGETETSGLALDEPPSNGTYYLTDIRWTRTEGCEPSPSSIEGVDQFAESTSDAYLCNDRTPADKNCTCPS